MRELEAITEFYGKRGAERSQVPLINHIHEGLAILCAIGADDIVKKAFCLHPIVQNSEEVDVSWSLALGLAEEYTHFANSYLCCEDSDHLNNLSGDSLFSAMDERFERVMPDQVAQMLYADKVQNQKDFLAHHSVTHPRRAELDQYFRNWLVYLINHKSVLFEAAKKAIRKQL